MKKPTFYQITDLHLYADEAIGSYGKGYDRKAQMDQKCMKESCAIIDAAFEEMIADKETDVIIISGDLTFDGEKASHDLLLTKLQKLKDAGKRVYLTTATHDYNKTACGYTEQGAFKVEQYTREQLRELYADYGWQEAIAEHKPSFSYVVPVFPGWRFLMLNDDGDGEAFCGFNDDQLAWIKAQVRDADAAGDRVIAVTHHPMLPPTKIYPIFSHRDMFGGYETTAPMFADLGIKYVFTGHTHMQSIKHIDTVRGNRMYHINTASITGHPAPYRLVTIEPDGLDIKTKNLQSFDWDLGGKTVDQYMKDHFLFMLEDIFDSMENDIEHFKQLAKTFSMDEKTVDRLRPLLKILGKMVNGVTFKGLARMFFVGSKVDPSVADKKVRDFMLELISDMYSGVRQFPPESKEYQSFMPVVRRIGRVVRLTDYYGVKVELSDLFDDLLYNVGPFDNNNAFLPF